MPSPLGFLWVGVWVGWGGRWSMTSVNRWLRIWMVFSTSVIWELILCWRSCFRMSKLAVISVRRMFILVLIILVKSVVMSLRIWSWISFAICDALGGAGWETLVWGLGAPVWVHFGFDLVNAGYSSVLKIRVCGWVVQFLWSGEWFHLLSVPLSVSGLFG